MKYFGRCRHNSQTVITGKSQDGEGRGLSVRLEIGWRGVSFLRNYLD